MFEKRKINQDRLVFIFILASISLVFFSALSSYSKWQKCSISNNYIKSYVSYPREKEEETNISHILFGIGASVETWKNRTYYNKLWWKPNVTRGFVWFDKKPMDDYTWPDNFPPYQVSEQNSPHHGPQSAVRVTRIVLESYRLGLENVRWFVMGDDDTVFFTENLVSVLSKYDHNQMYYIGGISESVEEDTAISYDMAFGGGGFAISYPLAAELANVLDDCLDRYTWSLFSDERIGACVKEIGVPLTKEPGFHQLDIVGDAYGLLAAHPVAPLVSLHHLDVVDPLFPTHTQFESLRILMGAYKEDPGRTLQQTFCHDYRRKWSILVSWGYTAQIYPRLMTAKELWTALLTFKKWLSWGNEAFTFNTRALGLDPCDHPIIYFFDRVDGVEEAQTHTSYKKLEIGPEKMCNRTDYIPALALHHINVLAPKMETTEWKKAPRRQCCDIMNSMDGVVDVRIRRCNLRENITLLP